MDGHRQSQTRTRVRVIEAGRTRIQDDRIATEEPLEIRLGIPGTPVQTAAVTMRTPGADFALAAGFLYSEGIVTSREEITRIRYCVDPELSEEQRYNVVTVDLRLAASRDLSSLDRHFAMTSACGVCGKASLDQIERRGIAPLPAGLQVPFEVIASLPQKLRQGQEVFARTGGLHAAGLFSASGVLLDVQEDVGRHNALDKLIGAALLDGRLPLHDAIVLLSGRASFELAQKCVAAGVPLLCAVSAPSSLAVDLAKRFNLTLIGFLRGDRCNLYHGAARIVLPANSPPS